MAFVDQRTSERPSQAAAPLFLDFRFFNLAQCSILFRASSAHQCSFSNVVFSWGFEFCPLESLSSFSAPCHSGQIQLIQGFSWNVVFGWGSGFWSLESLSSIRAPCHSGQILLIQGFSWNVVFGWGSGFWPLESLSSISAPCHSGQIQLIQGFSWNVVRDFYLFYQFLHLNDPTAATIWI